MCYFEVASLPYCHTCVPDDDDDAFLLVLAETINSSLQPYTPVVLAETINSLPPYPIRLCKVDRWNRETACMRSCMHVSMRVCIQGGRVRARDNVGSRESESENERASGRAIETERKRCAHALTKNETKSRWTFLLHPHHAPQMHGNSWTPSSSRESTRGLTF